MTAGAQPNPQDSVEVGVVPKTRIEDTPLWKDPETIRIDAKHVNGIWTLRSVDDDGAIAVQNKSIALALKEFVIALALSDREKYGNTTRNVALRMPDGYVPESAMAGLGNTIAAAVPKIPDSARIPTEEFERDGYRFEPRGEHAEGGGDFRVYRGDAYLELLCFTVDEHDRWRARVTGVCLTDEGEIVHGLRRLDSILYTKSWERAVSFALAQAAFLE